MNKSAITGIVVSVFALSASAARADEVKIGIVDMQKCIQMSESGKKAKSELESAFNKKKKELQEQEAGLKKMQEDYQKKKSALSESAQKEQERKLQEKFMKYQEVVQRSQSEIQKKEQEMSAPIIQNVRNKVTEIAKKKGFGIVLEKNDNIVIYSEDKFDITEEVMKSLN
ncbi:MAG: OmpH family outer membrane protein [Proteobacteria bacterium]|nr:OmpH family outer membrane protein [Pseudomonadota bacterium]